MSLMKISEMPISMTMTSENESPKGTQP